MGRNGNALPLIRPKSDCPGGGFHDDAPISYGLKTDGDTSEIRFLFCKKCKFIHWVEVKIEEPISPPTTDDDNPILDGTIHA